MNYRIHSFNPEAGEGEIEFSCSVGDFHCYAHPLWSIEELDRKNFSFFAFFVENIFLSDEEEFLIRKTDLSYFSYYLQGKYLGNNKIQIENYVFDIDGDIPSDIKQGEYISLDCARIDL